MLCVYIYLYIYIDTSNGQQKSFTLDLKCIKRKKQFEVRINMDMHVVNMVAISNET